MKEIIFKAINLFYKILCLVFKVRKNRIIMECDYGKGFYGNLYSIYNELNRKGLNYEVIIPVNKDVKLDIAINDNTRVIRTRTLRHIYMLATSKLWITNNHYYFFLNKRKETTLINTWHALGAFKKFGLDCQDGKSKDHIRDGKNIDFLLVSSNSLIPIYSKALGVESSKIISIGIPRTDMLFDRKIKQKINYNIENRLKVNGKKVLLYAPTFRDNEKEFFNLQLDLEYMYQHLKDEYVLLIKIHPIIRNKLIIDPRYKDFVIDVQSFNMNELLIYADILITDYSSVIFECALLEKPIIFFAYDLDEFLIDSRSFYFGYEEFIPDSPVRDTASVVRKIKLYQNDNNHNLMKLKEFSNKYCDYNDGKSSQRFVEKFLI